MKAHTKIMILLAFAGIAAFLVISNVSANRYNNQIQSGYEDIPEDPNSTLLSNVTASNQTVYPKSYTNDDEPNNLDSHEGEPNNVFYKEDTEPNAILYYPWPPDDDEPNSSSELNFEVLYNDENPEEPNELSEEEDPNDPELPIIFDQGTAVNSMDPNMPEFS